MAAMRKGGKVRLTRECCAKINMFLRITGKRPDGYHDVYTLFVPIDIYDTLIITSAQKTILRCSAAYIPANSSNIIMKVDEILRGEYGLIHNFDIELIKRIPVGAGLGGGSSDAAGYLALVNEAAELGLSYDEQCKIIARVGSDTVFFIKSVPSIGQGRGEILTDYHGLPDLHLLIVNPQISISTKDIYADPNLILTDKKNLPAVDEELTFDQMLSLMKNDMEVPVFKTYIKVKELVDDLNGFNSGRALMSGSGSTVFGVYNSACERDEAYMFIKVRYPSYFVKQAEVAKI